MSVKVCECYNGLALGGIISLYDKYFADFVLISNLSSC